MPSINSKSPGRSLPARGAWIEISTLAKRPLNITSLPARGAWIEMRPAQCSAPRQHQSLPARGAWIEISVPTGMSIIAPSRSPHGERGLKCGYCGCVADCRCRSPHGERGLKSHDCAFTEPPPCGRSPHGERGLKYPGLAIQHTHPGSLPARGAWIEISA